MSFVSVIEISAVVAGIIQGVLIMLNKKSNWIFYILQMALMVLFSTLNDLWGDVCMNSVFVVYGIYGMIAWNKSTEGSGITKLSQNQWLITLCALISFIGISYVALSKTNDPLPLLDSITTAGGFVATYLMVKHKLEAWIVWFVVDILYVVQYWLLPEQAFYLMALNVVWTVMAVISYMNWNKLYKKELL